MGLHFTPEEKAYVSANFSWGKGIIKEITKDLNRQFNLNRKPDSVRRVAKSLGVTRGIVKLPWHYSQSYIEQKSHFPQDRISRLVIKGTVPSVPYQRFVHVDFLALRRYVISEPVLYGYKRYQCLVCAVPLQGDLLCTFHIPVEEPKPSKPRDSINLKLEPTTHIDAIGSLLRQIRESRGLTLRELEAKSGYDRDVLSKLERNQNNAYVHFTHLLDIATALGYEVSLRLDKKKK